MNIDKIHCVNRRLLNYCENFSGESIGVVLKSGLDGLVFFLYAINGLFESIFYFYDYLNFSLILRAICVQFACNLRAI